jgi:hypothetical protein
VPRDIPWPDGADERFVCTDCIELGTCDEARYGYPENHIPECQLCGTVARTGEEGHLAYKIIWVFGRKTGRPVPHFLVFGDGHGEKYYCLDCLEIGQDEQGYDFPSDEAA